MKYPAGCRYAYNLRLPAGNPHYEAFSSNQSQCILGWPGSANGSATCRIHAGKPLPTSHKYTETVQILVTSKYQSCCCYADRCLLATEYFSPELELRCSIAHNHATAVRVLYNNVPLLMYPPSCPTRAGDTRRRQISKASLAW